MKKLIKSRKGVAIELALGVMFLMIAFTIMLLSAAGLQNSLRVQAYQSFNEMIEVNDVGERALALENLESGDTKYINVNGKTYTVHYTTTDTNNSKYEIYSGEVADTQTATPILVIEVTDGKITSWK